MNTEELMEALEKYLYLKQNFIEMLALVDGPNRGEFSTADAMEEQVTQVVHKVGHNLLEDWAKQQSNRAGLHLKRAMPAIHKHIKKNCTGTALSEE